jgi:hypothetical protein
MLGMAAERASAAVVILANRARSPIRFEAQSKRPTKLPNSKNSANRAGRSPLPFTSTTRSRPWTPCGESGWLIVSPQLRRFSSGHAECN